MSKILPHSVRQNSACFVLSHSRMFKKWLLVNNIVTTQSVVLFVVLNPFYVGIHFPG